MSSPLLMAGGKKNAHHLSNTYWVSSIVQVLLLWFILQSCEMSIIFPICREETEAQRGEWPCPSPPHTHTTAAAAGLSEARCSLRPRLDPPQMATLVPMPSKDGHGVSPKALRLIWHCVHVTLCFSLLPLSLALSAWVTRSFASFYMGWVHGVSWQTEESAELRRED